MVAFTLKDPVLLDLGFTTKSVTSMSSSLNEISCNNVVESLKSNLDGIKQLLKPLEEGGAGFSPTDIGIILHKKGSSSVVNLVNSIDHIRDLVTSSNSDGHGFSANNIANIFCGWTNLDTKIPQLKNSIQDLTELTKPISAGGFGFKAASITNILRGGENKIVFTINSLNSVRDFLKNLNQDDLEFAMQNLRSMFIEIINDNPTRTDELINTLENLFTTLKELTKPVDDGGIGFKIEDISSILHSKRNGEIRDPNVIKELSECTEIFKKLKEPEHLGGANFTTENIVTALSGIKIVKTLTEKLDDSIDALNLLCKPLSQGGVSFTRDQICSLIKESNLVPVETVQALIDSTESFNKLCKPINEGGAGFNAGNIYTILRYSNNKLPEAIKSLANSVDTFVELNKNVDDGGAGFNAGNISAILEGSVGKTGLAIQGIIDVKDDLMTLTKPKNKGGFGLNATYLSSKFYRSGIKFPDKVKELLSELQESESLTLPQHAIEVLEYTNQTEEEYGQSQEEMPEPGLPDPILLETSPTHSIEHNLTEATNKIFGKLKEPENLGGAGFTTENIIKAFSKMAKDMIKLVNTLTDSIDSLNLLYKPVDQGGVGFTRDQICSLISKSDHSCRETVQALINSTESFNKLCKPINEGGAGFNARNIYKILRHAQNKIPEAINSLASQADTFVELSRDASNGGAGFNARNIYKILEGSKEETHLAIDGIANSRNYLIIVVGSGFKAKRISSELRGSGINFPDRIKELLSNIFDQEIEKSLSEPQEFYDSQTDNLPKPRKRTREEESSESEEESQNSKKQTTENERSPNPVLLEIRRDESNNPTLPLNKRGGKYL